MKNTTAAGKRGGKVSQEFSLSLLMHIKGFSGAALQSQQAKL